MRRFGEMKKWIRLERPKKRGRRPKSNQDRKLLHANQRGPKAKGGELAKRAFSVGSHTKAKNIDHEESASLYNELRLRVHELMKIHGSGKTAQIVAVLKEDPKFSPFLSKLRALVG